MKKLIALAAGLVAALAVASAPASAAVDCTRGKLIFNGDDAVGIEFSAACPGMSRNLMLQGARLACPHGFIRAEPAKVSAATGGAMTREQRIRGDKRWHPVCDWAAVQNAVKN